MCVEHKCFKKMMKVATTPQSKEGYAYKIQKFMNYCVIQGTISHNEDFEMVR